MRIKFRSLFSVSALCASIALAGVPAAQAAEEKVSLVHKAIELNSPEGAYPGAFDTLIAAVLAADPAVATTLLDHSQETVFAPTDDAFAALGLDATNVGTALAQETLTKVLLYHVAPGRRYAEDVVSAERMRTLLKGKQGFFRVNGTVLTDNLGRTSNIIATDVEADNGVIHAIDTVLLPVQP
jgi:uncharacterized surface protein with fasciclin (FAS1) repeats